MSDWLFNIDIHMGRHSYHHQDGSVTFYEYPDPVDGVQGNPTERTVSHEIMDLVGKSPAFSKHLDLYIRGELSYEKMLEKAVIYLVKESRHRLDAITELIYAQPAPRSILLQGGP